MIRYIYSLIFIAVLLPALTSADEILKVGVIQSTTGIAAEDGTTVVQALQLAADRLNRQGTKVELLIEDDQTSPKNTVSAFRSLKTKKIDAVIGATWDFTTNAIMSLAGQEGTVVFNTSALPESINLREAKGYAFINAVSTYEEASPFADFVDKKKVKSAVIVYANNSWGETQRSVYRGIANRAGVSILGEYSSVSFDQNEWRTLIPLIKSRNPDLVLLLLNKNDLEVFVRRAAETGFNPKYFASKNAFDALKVSGDTSVYEGLCFTYPYKQLFSQKGFVPEYKERFGENPRIYADNSYDALFILAEAHKISIAKKIPLRKALLETEVKGLVGSYKYSQDKSFSLGKSSLMCVADEKAVLVE